MADYEDADDFDGDDYQEVDEPDEMEEIEEGKLDDILSEINTVLPTKDSIFDIV